MHQRNHPIDGYDRKSRLIGRAQLGRRIVHQVGDQLTEALSYVFFRSRLALFSKLAIPVLLMVVLFIIPLIYILRISFWEVERMHLVPTFSLQNYIYFLTEPAYQRAIWRSTRLALVVSAVCLALGYPLALILTKSRLRFASIVTLILISPLFVSVVIRVFGWLVLLQHQGLINVTLLRLGLISKPLKLIDNLFGVSIGLVNVLLIFMVVPIVAALVGIPRSLSEAARTLGANPLRAWWHITWPLSAPGVLAGLVLVFALSIGEYVQPRILAPAITLIPTQVYREVLGALNWPLGAAMGFVLLAISLFIAGLAFLTYAVFFPHTRVS